MLAAGPTPKSGVGLGFDGSGAGDEGTYGLSGPSGEEGGAVDGL